MLADQAALVCLLAPYLMRLSGRNRDSFRCFSSFLKQHTSDTEGVSIFVRLLPRVPARGAWGSQPF